MSISDKDRKIALWATAVAVPSYLIMREYLSTNQVLLVATGLAVVIGLVVIVAPSGKRKRQDAARREHDQDGPKKGASE